MCQKVIIISGTPGTGKTAIASYLNEKFEILSINLGEFAVKNQFILADDPYRDTKIIDEEKLVSAIINEIKRTADPHLIIEGHYADIIPNEFILTAVILRTDPFVLEERLKLRNYSEDKIKENIQAEILSDCGSYLLEKDLNNPIFEFDTSTLAIEQIGNEIFDLAIGKKDKSGLGKSASDYKPKIDWFSVHGDKLDHFFF